MRQILVAAPAMAELVEGTVEEEATAGVGPAAGEAVGQDSTAVAEEEACTGVPSAEEEAPMAEAFPPLAVSARRGPRP